MTNAAASNVVAHPALPSGPPPPVIFEPLAAMTPAKARLELARARFSLADRAPDDGLMTLAKLAQRFGRLVHHSLVADDGDVADALWAAAQMNGLAEHYGEDTLQNIITAGVEKGRSAPDEAQPKKRVLQATPFAWRDPTTIPRREWVYGNHLIRKFGSATVAPAGVGKSTLVLTEAIAMATGRALLGIKPKNRVRVWYWNGEDPAEEVERRIAAIVLHYEIDPAELVGWLFYDSGREQEIILARQTRDGAVVAEPVVESLVEVLKGNSIDVLTIDPFISSHRVTENDNNAIEVVAKCWTAIAERTNCAIELVHHARKTGGAEVTVEDSRGASALMGAVRSARAINAMSKEEGERAGVITHRRFFRVENGKSNLAPPPDGADWHEIVSVPLGNGSEMFPDGDLIGVVRTWSWPDPLAEVTAADFEMAASIISGGKWRESPQAAQWVGKAVAQALGLDLAKLADKAKVCTVLKAWLSAGSLRVVEATDERRMLRKFVQVSADV